MVTSVCYAFPKYHSLSNPMRHSLFCLIHNFSSSFLFLSHPLFPLHSLSLFHPLFFRSHSIFFLSLSLSLLFASFTLSLSLFFASFTIFLSLTCTHFIYKLIQDTDNNNKMSYLKFRDCEFTSIDT